MRKLSLIVLLLFACNLVSIADTQKYNPNRPEWDDLCPYGMANVTLDNKKHIPGTKAAWKAEEQNYWVQRREDFEKGLAFCDGVEASTQNACYEKLVAKQQKISAEHITPEQRWEQTIGKLQMVNGAVNEINQNSIQRQQLEIQRTNMLMQNAPKWNADAYMPKTYNVNLKHTVNYNGF